MVLSLDPNPIVAEPEAVDTFDVDDDERVDVLASVDQACYLRACISLLVIAVNTSFNLGS